ncbi:MAG: OmpA family protein [Desulfobacteraceae bacterium]|nr:MAG: OmpA family protein [Desulfobacteraceae bacterium]
MKMRRSRLAIFFAAGIVAIGCATPQSQELKQAQQSYSLAKDDPSITQNASVTLYEGKQALDRAQRAEEIEEQKHYAYVAQKKIDLARVQADQLQTRQEVEELQEQQESFLLALRRKQAEQARQRAEQAQEELQAYRGRERQQELSRAQEETQSAQQEVQRAEQEAQQAQAELQQLRQEMSDMDARQTETGMVLTLSDVIFEFDQAQLKTGAERSIGRLSEFLNRHPDRKVLVEGFTDSVGSDQYNRSLSERRAEAVAQALEADGVSPDRISTRGLGEDYPLATNETVAGRQQNRRVEITILNPEQQPEDAGRGDGRM